MTSAVSSKPDEYRRYAQECWKLANDAEAIESKAVFQLTAEAWTMLAAQVETLEGALGSEAINPAPFPEFAA
jgi:hypothetical protein